VTNPHAATIAYTSSNEAAATVDADGLVTLVAEGETTITLNIEFDDGTEAASESAPQQATRSRKKGARSAQSQTRAAATETLTYTLTVA
ncbi:hypothetical protein CGK40_26305, partial [Vibrio parahaemolyticus]